MQQFSLRDFEAAKFTPVLEVETIEAFIGRFPGESFNKGISKRLQEYLMAMFGEYGSSSREVKESDYLALEDYEAVGGLALGILARVDPMQIKKPEDLWALSDTRDIEGACLDHEDLPAGQLPPGIRAEGLREKKFTCDDYFRTEGKSKDGTGYEVLAPNDPLIQHGYFVNAGMPFSNTGRAWDTMSEEAIRAICLENNIKPARSKITMIRDLVNANVPLPIQFYRPTEKLQAFFRSLWEVYITDVREHTAHFHPLYFESLWEDVADCADDNELAEKAYQVLREAPWENNLVTVVSTKPLRKPKMVKQRRRSYQSGSNQEQPDAPVEKPAGLKLAGLTRESVLEAIKTIDVSKLSKSQLNSSYQVTIDDQAYPFKLLVEKAYKIANGFALPAGTFKEYFYLVKQFENFTGFSVAIDAYILFRNAIKDECYKICHPSRVFDSSHSDRLDLSVLGPSVNDPVIKKKRFRNEPGLDALEPGAVIFLVTDKEVYGVVKVVNDENISKPFIAIEPVLMLEQGPAHGVDFSDRNYPIIEVHFYDDEFKSLCKTLDRHVPDLVQNAVADLKGVKPVTVTV